MYNRANYLANREERIAKMKARYATLDKEKLAQYRREYHLKNKEKIRQRHDIYYRDYKNRKRSLDQSPKRKYEMYRDNAKRKGKPWQISLDEFMSFWQKPCAYCGDTIELVGLDRIDNNQGYTLDNLVPCCSKCNIFKNKFSQQDFLNHCRKIVKLNGQQEK